MDGTELKTGKFPVNCPECGCPGLRTRNNYGDGNVVEHDVWAYEPVDRLMEDLRCSEAVLREICRLHDVPPEQLEFVRRRYDPLRGQVKRWCGETAAPGCYRDAGEGI